MDIRLFSPFDYDEQPGIFAAGTVEAGKEAVIQDRKGELENQNWVAATVSKF